MHYDNKACGMCGLDRVDGRCAACFPTPIEAIQQSQNLAQGNTDAFYSLWSSTVVTPKPTDVVSEWKLLAIDPGFENAGVAWATCRRFGNNDVEIVFQKNRITTQAMIPRNHDENNDAHLDVVRINSFFNELFRGVDRSEQVTVVFETQFFRAVPTNMAFLSCRLYTLHRLANSAIHYMGTLDYDAQGRGRNLIAFNVSSSAVSKYFDKKHAEHFEKNLVPTSKMTRYSKKKKVIAQIADLYGYTPKNDHEADAILSGIFHVALGNKVVSVRFE